MQYKDYYSILGVEKNATADEIKKASIAGLGYDLNIKAIPDILELRLEIYNSSLKFRPMPAFIARGMT